MRVKVGHRTTGLTPPPVIVTGHPKAVLSLRFHFFMFGAVRFLNVLILTLLYVRIVWFSKNG